MNGFSQNNDRDRIDIIKRRLTPGLLAMEQGNGPEQLVAAGKTLVKKFGMDLVHVILSDLIHGGSYPAAQSYFVDKGVRECQGATPDEFNDRALDVMAAHLRSAGLEPWKHLRRADQGFMLTKAARAVVERSGFSGLERYPAPEDLDGVGINRNPYWHDLAEMRIIDGEEVFNAHGYVSFLINAALFNFGDPEKASGGLKQLVSKVNPLIDFSTLLSRSEYDDRWLLRLATLAAEGYERIAAESRNP